MNDREHAKWVRDSVVTPTIKKWGANAWAMLGQELREELIAAAVMRVVISWATKTVAVENPEIVRFYREAMRQVRRKKKADFRLHSN